MRALVMRLLPDKRREKVLVRDWPEPKGPAANQVKTRTLYTGVTNGTERNNLVRGNYAMADRCLPAGYGYQNVGRVIEVGADVKRLKAGDLLFMSADHVEYVVMPEDGLLGKVPEGVEPREAALFGMASVAMHDVRRAGTTLGHRVLVVGAGPIGQFTAQGARAAGAHVTICDLSGARLRTARECGAHAAIEVGSDDAWKRVKEAGAFDIVFEDSGANVLDKIIGRTWGDGLLRSRSTIVLIAGRNEVTYNFNAAQGWELTVLHAGHFTTSDLAEVGRLVAEGVIRVGPILQDVVPAAEAERIYTLLRDDPAKLMGTVFEW